jgi:hypothetical protein
MKTENLMANFVTNRIRLIGNESIRQLAKEINRRINLESAKNNNAQDLSIVGKVLYGYDDEDASLSEEIEAKWVHPDGQMAEADPLRLVSGWAPVKEIQEHILWHAFQLDPKVIVYMEYDDEAPNFIGARYALIDDYDVYTFESEVDTSDMKVCFEDELEEQLEKNKLTQEYEKVIDWDGLWNMLYEQQLNAYNQMKKKFKWVKDDYIR